MVTSLGCPIPRIGAKVVLIARLPRMHGTTLVVEPRIPRERLSLDLPGEVRAVDGAGWSVPAVAEEVAGARIAAVALAREHGLPEQRSPDVALAVSEAISNAVMHAFRDRPAPGTITVEVHAMGAEHVEVVVRDDGMGLSPRDDSPGLGFGLSLIERSADQVEHRRPPGGVGFELRMRFRLESEGDR